MTQDNTIKTINMENSPYRFFFLLVPFALVAVLGMATMGTSDTSLCIWWAVFLLLMGIITLPLAAKLWENFSSGGFFLSQPMGLIFTCLILWTFAHLKLFKLNMVCILISALIVAALCYVPKSLRQSLISKLDKKGFVEAVVVEETVFLLIFFLMCYFKGFLPNINGQEKYMDYGFIMSMLRNENLPANDMWLSGHSINYYYFGQYIWAVVIKATGIPSGVGYNLAMCSATAIPFGMSFSIGKFLIEAASKKGFMENKIVKYVAGFLTGCAVSLWGNSHSFFYDENSAGNKLLGFFSKLGINVGRTTEFFYPDSTRFIGWNPTIENNHGGDFTIEEFPFYSFLVGDLHAHVISMMIVLLISAVILSLICSVKLPDAKEIAINPSLDNLNTTEGRIFDELGSTFTPHLVLLAVLLGCAQMTNYWDFLIYFVFCSMGLFIANTMRSARFTNILGAFVFFVNVGAILLVYLSSGSNPPALFGLELLVLIASTLFCIVNPSALPRTSCQMSFLFTLACLTALPFNINFDMISNSLGKVKDRSSLYQLFILYGTHVFISVFFLVVVAISKNYRYSSQTKANKSKVKQSANGVIGSEYSFTNPIQKFFGQRNLIDVYVCGMVIVGIMLLAAPEIFYVRDIYTGGYLRSNTMFKFAFAAFIVLSTTMIYSVIRLLWFVKKDGKYSMTFFTVAIIFAFLLLVPAHYTMASLKQRCGELKRENYKTLDGTAYLSTHTSYIVSDNYSGNLVPYQACIEWFNSSVKGSPVICEAYGDSYTDSCIVSAYTGLPTVFGWQTHEWLWRFHGIVDQDSDTLVSDPTKDVWQLYITPRHQDVDVIYVSENLNDIQNIINKYQIEYIVLGDMERFKYGYDNYYMISQLGDVAFQNGTLTVFKVNPVPGQ